MQNETFIKNALTKEIEMNNEGHASIPNSFSNVQSLQNKATKNISVVNKKRDAVINASRYFAKNFHNQIFGDYNDWDIYC
jgi:hypothetical protein